ncbi:hypothetical protein BS47DRAFT_1484907 [Hydnum rufescens UP504]|uniref:Uncharacterized protein n=1 Tax=Hydnum rufescens UP504 TaxID=1448309 RepID=A0A9P6AZB1_9AGAM|nr:hypothetical protein BS47DRAFT_1484907 [Hydnum rufescens UP504]
MPPMVVGILRRDVSLYNIVSIVAVLVEFHLAQETHLMLDGKAIDLLGDVPAPRLLRRNLEVIVWFTYRYKNGQERSRALRSLKDRILIVGHCENSSLVSSHNHIEIPRCLLKAPIIHGSHAWHSFFAMALGFCTSI